MNLDCSNEAASFLKGGQSLHRCGYYVTKGRLGKSGTSRTGFQASMNRYLQLPAREFLLLNNAPLAVALLAFHRSPDDQTPSAQLRSEHCSDPILNQHQTGKVGCRCPLPSGRVRRLFHSLSVNSMRTGYINDMLIFPREDELPGICQHYASAPWGKEEDSGYGPGGGVLLWHRCGPLLRSAAGGKERDHAP